MLKSKTNFYKSCNHLPIENFYEILNTNNLDWLRIDHVDGNEYDTDDSVVLKALWDSIHEEYVDLLNQGGNKDFTIIASVLELEKELAIVSHLFSVYDNRNSKALAKEIDAWGYYPKDSAKSLKKLQTIQFRISIIKSKNRDLFEEPDKDNNETIEYDLFNDVVLLEEVFGSGKVIDVKKTVVAKWVRYIKTAEENSKKNNS
jgi:hypothetical protein